MTARNPSAFRRAMRAIPPLLFGRTLGDVTPSLRDRIASDPRVFLPIAGYLVAGLEIVSLEIDKSALGGGGHARFVGKPRAFPGAPVGEGEVRARLSFDSVAWSSAASDRGRGFRRFVTAMTIDERAADVPASALRFPKQWDRAQPAPIAVGSPIVALLDAASSAARRGPFVHEYAVTVGEPAQSVASPELEIVVAWDDRRPAWPRPKFRLALSSEGRTLVEASAEPGSSRCSVRTREVAARYALSVTTEESEAPAFYRLTTQTAAAAPASG